MGNNKLWIGSLAAMIISGCAWHEPTRVQDDFGNSVRTMIAEQLYDANVAREPLIGGPDTLAGSAAASSVGGYEVASKEARLQRSRTTGSPIPVVGTISDTKKD